MQNWPFYLGSPERCRPTLSFLAPPLKEINVFPDDLRSVFPPRIFDGIAYFTTLLGVIRAFDLKTGKELWQASITRGPNEDELNMVYDGEVLVNEHYLVTGYKRNTLVFDPKTGEKLFFLDYEIVPGMSVLKEHRLYSINSRQCFCIDLQQKDRIWRKRWQTTDTPIVMGGNKIYVVFGSAALSCLDADTGKEEWRTSVAELGSHKSKMGRPIPGKFTGSPAWTGESLIVTVRAEKIASFSESGHLNWEEDITRPENIEYSQGIIFGLNSNEFCMFNFQDGGELERVEVEEEFKSFGRNPTLSKFFITATHIYFGATNQGTLGAFNIETKKIDWTHICEDMLPTAFPPMIVDGRLYAVDVSGKVYVFESESAA